MDSLSNVSPTLNPYKSISIRQKSTQKSETNQSIEQSLIEKLQSLSVINAQTSHRNNNSYDMRKVSFYFGAQPTDSLQNLNPHRNISQVSILNGISQVLEPNVPDFGYPDNELIDCLVSDDECKGKGWQLIFDSVSRYPKY